MGLTAKKTGDGGNFEPISQGLHHAVCYALYDLGTQYNEKFGKSIHKVLIGWEIPMERIEIERDGKMLNLPRAISKQYTLSLHEKANLRKELESWRGRAFTEAELDGFDLQKLLGANCMVQVIHQTKNDKTYANVSSVVSLPKGTEKRTAENDLQFFSFEDNPGSIPDKTPDWIVDIIKASEEWQEIQHGGGSGNKNPWDEVRSTENFIDDIPF